MFLGIVSLAISSYYNFNASQLSALSQQLTSGTAPSRIQAMYAAHTLNAESLAALTGNGAPEQVTKVGSVQQEYTVMMWIAKAFRISFNASYVPRLVSTHDNFSESDLFVYQLKTKNPITYDTHNVANIYENHCLYLIDNYIKFATEYATLYGDIYTFSRPVMRIFLFEREEENPTADACNEFLKRYENLFFATGNKDMYQPFYVEDDYDDGLTERRIRALQFLYYAINSGNPDERYVVDLGVCSGAGIDSFDSSDGSFSNVLVYNQGLARFRLGFCERGVRPPYILPGLFGVPTNVLNQSQQHQTSPSYLLSVHTSYNMINQLIDKYTSGEIHLPTRIALSNIPTELQIKRAAMFLMWPEGNDLLLNQYSHNSHTLWLPDLPPHVDSSEFTSPPPAECIPDKNLLSAYSIDIPQADVEELEGITSSTNGAAVISANIATAPAPLFSIECMDNLDVTSAAICVNDPNTSLQLSNCNAAFKTLPYTTNATDHHAKLTQLEAKCDITSSDSLCIGPTCEGPTYYKTHQTSCDKIGRTFHIGNAELNVAVTANLKGNCTATNFSIHILADAKAAILSTDAVTSTSLKNGVSTGFVTKVATTAVKNKIPLADATTQTARNPETAVVKTIAIKHIECRRLINDASEDCMDEVEFDGAFYGAHKLMEKELQGTGLQIKTTDVSQTKPKTSRGSTIEYETVVTKETYTITSNCDDMEDYGNGEFGLKGTSSCNGQTPHVQYAAKVERKSQSSDDDDKLSGGAIAGIVLGSVAGVAAVGYVGYRVSKRQGTSSTYNALMNSL